VTYRSNHQQNVRNSRIAQNPTWQHHAHSTVANGCADWQRITHAQHNKSAKEQQPAQGNPQAPCHSIGLTNSILVTWLVTSFQTVRVAQTIDAYQPHEIAGRVVGTKRENLKCRAKYRFFSFNNKIITNPLIIIGNKTSAQFCNLLRIKWKTKTPKSGEGERLFNGRLKPYNHLNWKCIQVLPHCRLSNSPPSLHTSIVGLGLPFSGNAPEINCSRFSQNNRRPKNNKLPHCSVWGAVYWTVEGCGQFLTECEKTTGWQLVTIVRRAKTSKFHPQPMAMKIN